MPYKNKDKGKGYRKRYYQKNKDKIDRKNKEWRINNPEKIKIILAKSNTKNRNRKLKYDKEWRKKKGKQYFREYYNKTKDKQREYRNRWRDANKISINKKGKIYRTKHKKQYLKWYLKNRNNITKYNTEWKKKNKDKLKLYRAKELKNISGERKKRLLINKKATYHIQIPKNKLCVECKKRKATLRHHKDYSKPLEVKLLCRVCHSKIHRKYK